MDERGPDVPPPRPSPTEGEGRSPDRTRRTRQSKVYRKEGKTPMGAEARLAELKLELPPAPKPVATYVPANRQGDLLYVSGHGPIRPDGTMPLGKLGAALDVTAGKAAAKQTGLAIL